MHESDEKENTKKPDRRRALLLTLICVCLLIMLASTASILYSLHQLRILSAEEPVSVTADTAATVDPYFVPTPEPLIPQTPRPTPVPTPEPTPESPWGWKDYGGKEVYLLPGSNLLTGLHLIDGKLHYFNEYGEHAKSLGVDVSYHNKGINWEAVRAQGIDFAIIRLGYRGWETGLLHEDVCFRQNLLGAKAAGLKVGVYLYSTAVNVREAQEEAAFILTLLNGVKLDLPVYLDTEQSGEYPFGRADRLHKECVRYVKASAQAHVMQVLLAEHLLAEDEEALARRAHNHRIATKPKNADPLEYKWATAFEALLGYLSASGREDRLAEIVRKAAELTEAAEGGEDA